MSRKRVLRRPFVLAVMVVLALLFGQTIGFAGALAITYDLDADGLGSSFVEEFPRLGPGFQYPIVGNIRLTLNPDRPFLENVDSDILVPPDVPLPYSQIVWSQPELFFVGEYLSDALSADVSMRFYFSPVLATLDSFIPIPPYELFIDLTEARSKLELRGGYFGIALGTIAPNSAVFSVHGRAIPEPASGALLLFGIAGIIASRRMR